MVPPPLGQGTGRSPGSIFNVGDVVNNSFRIEALLGRGGTSEVYRARTEFGGKRVALKVLRYEYSDNEAFLRLMEGEERIREIQHDAIVRYFHGQRSTATGQAFLVMDFVDGPGLDRRMCEGSVSAADLMVLAERVASGLQAAHAKRIFHRDLSPDNIILRNGNPAEAVIIDFGIAKDANPGAQTVIGSDFAGKYAYAAPEQLGGRTDGRSDIYALGALLLAAYRGKADPVETDLFRLTEAKARPLDTSGVPEPLKSLIDRITDPDPDRRLQNADAVLDFIRKASAADDPIGAPPPGEATVIAARPVAQKPASQPGAPASRAGTRSGSLGGSRGPLWLALALLLVAGGGLAAWFGGAADRLLGPRLELAEPYRLHVERLESATPVAEGHVPSEEVRAALAQRLTAAGGVADLTLARGNIAENWGAGVVALVDVVAPLDAWSLDVTDNRVAITGLTEDRALRDRLAALPGTAMPAGLTGTVEIELGPRILDPTHLGAILAAHEDCGTLTLIDPPPGGYPQGSRIIVDGQVATTGTGAALAEALAKAAGDREVLIRARTLNPTLCLVGAAIPDAPAGGFGLGFLDGTTGIVRKDGRFVVGDNPVIEVTIPASASEGYLYVSALDVSGSVFHLLPNQFREDNSIPALRNGQAGDVIVRLAFSEAEARQAAEAGTRKLSFLVDNSSLGDTEVVAIHSDAPLFDGLRPTTESADSFVKALDSLQGPIASLDSRILTTVASN